MNSEWEEVPFSEAIDFKEGPGIMARDFRDEGVPLIRVAGLSGAASVLHGCNFLDPEKVNSKWSHFRVRPGDSLLSTSASLGRVAVAGPEAEGAIPYTGIIRMRPRDTKVTASFVPYLLKSPHFQRQAEAMGTGSVLRHFGPSHLKRMTVVLPPVEDQRRIAWLLGSLDAKIDCNQRMAKTLEEIAATLFKARFVDFVDHDDLVESEIGPIPRGWRVIPLSEAVAVNPRIAAIKKGSMVPHVGMSDVPSWGTRPSRGVEPREYAGGARFEPGDTLMARITGCIEHGKGAFVDFLDGPGAGSTEFLVFRARPPLTPEMVFLLSRTPRVREHAIANMSGSSGRQRVQTSAFDYLPIAVPPNSETLAEEAGLFHAIFECTREIWQENQTLAAVRDAVLPRLISGQIRVPTAGSEGSPP